MMDSVQSRQDAFWRMYSDNDLTAENEGMAS